MYKRTGGGGETMLRFYLVVTHKSAGIAGFGRAIIQKNDNGTAVSLIVITQLDVPSVHVTGGTFAPARRRWAGNSDGNEIGVTVLNIS